MFDFTTTLNEEIMIRCYLKDLKSSVRAKIDARDRDLESWEKAVEKAVNTKTKAMFQSSSNICDMDSKSP